VVKTNTQFIRAAAAKAVDTSRRSRSRITKSDSIAEERKIAQDWLNSSKFTVSKVLAVRATGGFVITLIGGVRLHHDAKTLQWYASRNTESGSVETSKSVKVVRALKTTIDGFIKQNKVEDKKLSEIKRIGKDKGNKKSITGDVVRWLKTWDFTVDSVDDATRSTNLSINIKGGLSLVQENASKLWHVTRKSQHGKVYTDDKPNADYEKKKDTLIKFMDDNNNKRKRSGSRSVVVQGIARDQRDSNLGKPLSPENVPTGLSDSDFYKRSAYGRIVRSSKLRPATSATIVGFAMHEGKYMTVLVPRDFSKQVEKRPSYIFLPEADILKTNFDTAPQVIYAEFLKLREEAYIAYNSTGDTKPETERIEIGDLKPGQMALIQFGGKSLERKILDVDEVKSSIAVRGFNNRNILVPIARILNVS